MKQSESIIKLVPALIKAVQEMPSVPLDSINPYFKSKYASLKSVLDTVQPILKKHDLITIAMPISSVTPGGVGLIGIENIIMHTSGEWISERIEIPLEVDSKKSAQDSGIIITYLRRYSISSMLALYAEEDTDGNSTGSTKPPAHEQTSNSYEEKAKESLNKALANTKALVEEHNAKLGTVLSKAEVIQITLKELEETAKVADDPSKQRSLASMMYRQIVPDDDVRHALAAIIFRTTEWNKVSDKLAVAFLDYVKAVKREGNYIPRKQAVEELTAAANEIELPQMEIGI